MLTMANSDYPNHTTLARNLHAYLRWRNANNRHPTSSQPNAANATNAGTTTPKPKPPSPAKPGDASRSTH
jgi:hypothetical protein